MNRTTRYLPGWALVLGGLLLLAACSTLPRPEGSGPNTADADTQKYDELCRDAWSEILKGSYASALSILDLAVELRPEEGLAWAYRGEASRMLGNYQIAAADLDRALALQPEDTFSLERRGEVYRVNGDFDRALHTLSLAIRLNPDSDFAYGSRGEAWRQVEDFEAAIEDFDCAVELSPNYSWALARRGESYRMLGLLDAALADLDRAIELAPQDSYAYASRGQTYWQLEEPQKALADLDKAISLEPGYTWAIERRSEIMQEMQASSAGRAAASTRSGPSAALRLGPIPLVTVFDFAIENLPPSEGRLIVDLLTSALVQTRSCRVLERRQREILLKEIEFSLSECSDEQCQLEAGRLLSADQIVVGSLGRVGQRYLINAKLLAVQTGEVLSSAYQVYRSLEELVDGCAEIADALVS